MKKIKTISGKKTPRQAHTDNVKTGMGTNYGTGVKAPVGKMRDGLGINIPQKKLKIPPKSLA
jgi:hypothetical protein